MPILELLNSLAHNVPHTPYIILFTLGFIVLIKLLLPPRNKPATIAFTKAPTATNAERVTGLLIGTAVGDAKGAPFIGMTREAVQIANAATPRGTSPVFSPVPVNHPNIRRPEDFPPGSWSDVTAAAVGSARALTTRDLSASASTERKRALDDLNAGARLGGVGPALASVGPVALLFAMQRKQPSGGELLQAVSAVVADPKVLPFALLHARTLLRLFANETLDVWSNKEGRAAFLADAAADAAEQERSNALPVQISSALRTMQARVAQDALTDDEVLQAAAAFASSAAAAALLVQAYGLWAMRPPGFTTLVKGALTGGAAPHALAALLGQMLGGIRGQGFIPHHYTSALRTNPAPLTALGDDLAATAERRRV